MFFLISGMTQVVFWGSLTLVCISSSGISGSDWMWRLILHFCAFIPVNADSAPIFTLLCTVNIWKGRFCDSFMICCHIYIYIFGCSWKDFFMLCQSFSLNPRVWFLKFSSSFECCLFGLNSVLFYFEHHHHRSFNS